MLAARTTLDALLPNPDVRVVAPGRVNLLGEHVDYNGGPVLPAAIDRAVQLSVQARADRQVRLQALDMGQSVVFDLGSLDSKQDLDGQPLPDWAMYPAGVAWELQQRGLAVSGIDGVFTSNVPIGSGLSSSAALEMAFGIAWRVLGGWEMDAMELAKMGQRAENRYVGVQCGLMDQFASANGVAGHALYLDTRTLDWHPVPLPQSATLIIADSGMRRTLANSAYNERRAACEQAVQLLKPHLPEIELLCDVSPTDFHRLAHHLPDLIQKRARHVVEECDRVQQAVQALAAGDEQTFGQLMLAGHASLRDLYEVSIPELDTLVEIAANLPGCWGARLTGAGFGGCTVNLVEESQAEAFIAALSAGYQEKTGRTAQVYLCRATQGAHQVLDETGEAS